MKKVGTITTAVGLLALGIALLVHSINPGVEWLSNPIKWWPLLLIGLGIEILVKRIRTEDKDMKIDPLIVVFFLGILAAGCYNLMKTEIVDSGVLGWKNQSTHHYLEQAALNGVKQISVESLRGEVVLRQSTDGKVKAETDLSLRSNRKIVFPNNLLSISQEGDKIVIREQGSELPSYFHQINTRTVIYLPPIIPVSIESVDQLDGGNISNPLTVSDVSDLELSDLASGLNVNSDSGQIVVRNARGKVQVNSNDGQIRLYNIPAGVQLAIDSGNIDLSEVYGKIDVTSDSGNVNLRNIKAPNADCHIRNHEGNIDLSSGQLTDCRLMAVVGEGNLVMPQWISVPNNQASESIKTVNYTFGKGNKSIELLIDQGTITVR
ncbi:MAG: DUF4097 family beta strand repeat-containing protein [Chitinophagales bacterium]